MTTMALRDWGRWGRWVAGAGALLGLVACSAESHTGASVGPGPVEVGVIDVRMEEVVRHVELPGRVVAFRAAEVRPQVSGIVMRRLFEEGGQVQAGDVLFELDDAIYRAAHAQAEALLRKAKDHVDSLGRTARRSAELMALDGISRQAHEDAEAALRQAQAERDVAQAALMTAKLELERTRIRAPIAGRIGRALVSEGALVTREQDQALAHIVQLDPVAVDVVQPGRELLSMSGSGELGHELNTVRILLDDGTPYPWPGELRFSEARVEQATGVVTLRVRAPNPEGRLLPGMFVRAELAQKRWPQAILLPYQALRPRAEGRATVWVVGPEERVEERLVHAQTLVRGGWLVSEGLLLGERVIVEGGSKVAAGDVVKVAPWNGAGEGAVPALRSMD